jgi:Zn-dependent M28 family amino/carboxypeptidase
MRILALAPLALLLPDAAQAQEKPDPAHLKASVEKLVSFGTRHTLSDPDNPTRGIGAARRWFAGELSKIGDRCNCIEVANIARTFTGDRAPNGVEIVDVLGFQAGTDPKRVVIVMGHIDSRVTDVMNATADAPGANDDGSGTALVLEAARILSKEKFRATIIYAALSGEEQGLYGGQLLAETAKERGWMVTAVLNNDIVGNTVGTNGQKVANRVRVFSETFSDGDDPKALRGVRADGAEDDGPSRALAKAIGQVAGKISGGLDAFLVRRPDRFGRGGDHSPFLKLGYPAVRFSVGVENYDAQHQDLVPGKGDTADKMDFPYLAKVTAINIATIRRLATAPAAPDKVTIGGALSTDTSVKWAAVPGAVKYRIHWRRADARDWTDQLDVTGTEASLKNVVVDDSFIGVSAIGADGAESLVTFGRR